MKPRMVDYYMEIAEVTAKLSRARRLQVGCVIVKNDNIVSFGWNGTPPGWDNNCEDEYVDNVNMTISLKTRPEVIHAEANALMKLCRTHESSQGADLFLTHAPCIDCAKLIASAGINNVYYRNQYRNIDGIDFLKKSGIESQQV